MAKKMFKSNIKRNAAKTEDPEESGLFEKEFNFRTEDETVKQKKGRERQEKIEERMAEHAKLIYTPA